MYQIFTSFSHDVLERVASYPLADPDEDRPRFVSGPTHIASVLGACLNVSLGVEGSLERRYYFPSWGEIAKAIGGDEYHLTRLAQRFERDLERGKITDLRAAMGLPPASNGR